MFFGLFSSSKISKLRQRAASDPTDLQCRIELAELLEKQADEAPRSMHDYGEPSAKEKYQSILNAYQEACVLRMELVKLQFRGYARNERHNRLDAHPANR
jgi:hypothetical protein